MRTKRYIAWVALFALALSLMACKKDSDSKKDDGGEKPSTGQNSDGKKDDSKEGKYTVEISASEGVKLLAFTVKYDGKSEELTPNTEANGFSRSYEVKNTSAEDGAFSIHIVATGKQDGSSMLQLRIFKGSELLKGYDLQGKYFNLALDV